MHHKAGFMVHLFYRMRAMDSFRKILYTESIQISRKLP